MRFLITEPTYVAGVYIAATGQSPTVLPLPDDSKHVSLHQSWQPLDKAAQRAQVEQAKRSGVLRDLRRTKMEPREVNGKVTQVEVPSETESEHQVRNQFRLYPHDWAGNAIVERPEGATVTDPRSQVAPLPPSAQKNPLGA